MSTYNIWYSCSNNSEKFTAPRFLQRETYTPLDLFNESQRGLVELKGGTLSVDDSVLDTPYSHQMALVGYFWSGKYHRVVIGT